MNNTTVNHRNNDRYLVRWKIAVVFDDAEKRPTFHGRTDDLSLSGTGMHTDLNLFATMPVVILLAPPPLVVGQPLKLIEIQARQAYAVYSGAASCFRLGFEFIKFKDDGLTTLKDQLKHHRPKMPHKPWSG